MRIGALACLFVLLTLPALTQQIGVPPRTADKMWANREIRPEPPREADIRAARFRAIHQDAEDLSRLSTSLQSELQQLQKGVLPKDLAQDLKKAEKLAKRLRQEVAE